MSSYLITGASRGIGYEFVRNLSADPANVVVGLVRDKEATDKKVAAELGRSNIHIIQGDVTDYNSLKVAAEETAKITGGGLDYLIANGARVATYSGYLDFEQLSEDPQRLEEDLVESFKTNTVGQIHLFSLFIPLIRQGRAKKVIAISTGMADLEAVRKWEIGIAGPYAISKAALNMAVAKFSSIYNKEGILFMSISPGLVDTADKNVQLTEVELKGLQSMVTKFQKAAPDWKGALTPEESVKAVLSVIYESSVEKGDGGSLVSHHGNQEWL